MSQHVTGGRTIRVGLAAALIGLGTFSAAAHAGRPASAGADLALALSDSPDPVVVGNTVTYTLFVTNQGRDQAAAVTVGDTLPTDISLVTYSASQGSCENWFDSSVDCSLGSLANGASATVQITVRTGSPGTLTDNGSVSSDTSDPHPSNNTATATTTVQLPPGPYLTGSVTGPDTAQAGLPYDVAATLTNSNEAGPVSVTWASTTPVLVLAAGTDHGSCTAAPASPANVQCALGTLANMETVHLTLQVVPLTVSHNPVRTVFTSNYGNQTISISQDASAAAPSREIAYHDTRVITGVHFVDCESEFNANGGGYQLEWWLSCLLGPNGGSTRGTT